jgi:hypothetical protein
LISHKEFEDLPFEPLATWKVYKPTTSDLLMQSFAIADKAVKKFVTFSMFGVYSHSNTRVRSIYAAGEPSLIK